MPKVFAEKWLMLRESYRACNTEIAVHSKNKPKHLPSVLCQMSFGSNACHYASWDRFGEILNIFCSKILPCVENYFKKLIGGSDISGMILDRPFYSMPTVFYYINVRTLGRPHHTTNIICVFIFLYNMSSMHWGVVILKKHSCLQGNVEQ